MDAFIIVLKKDSKVRVKIDDILDRYNRISPKYQSKLGYDTLIQNVILKDLINIMGTVITDLDIEIKMKINGNNYLESKTNSQIFKRVW